MKRKKEGNAATDLRSFLERTAAKKKQSQASNVLQSNNESQMQLVVFQGHSGIGASTQPPEPVADEQGQQQNDEAETPIMEDDESMSVDEANSSDADFFCVRGWLFVAMMRQRSQTMQGISGNFWHGWLEILKKLIRWF
jgi:hypothetical protein